MSGMTLRIVVAAVLFIHGIGHFMGMMPALQLATVDIHLRLPIQSIGYSDVESAEQYTQVGYEAACKVLETADTSPILFI